MDKIKVRGGRRLQGVVQVSGAKNAVLPAMAAALLTSEPLVLENAPQVRDVSTMIRVLRRMGAAEPDRRGSRLTLQVPEIVAPEAPYELVKTMRASVLVLGPLLARCGAGRVSLPGGCAIGARPVNLHVAALQKLGARIEVEHGYMVAEGRELRGAEITFESKTVTGTENLMMAAARARGRTVLRNVAEEPEIGDLAVLLNAMGGKVEGAGSDTIIIDGVERLHGAVHPVIPDRIEAGTFLMAAAITQRPRRELPAGPPVGGFGEAAGCRGAAGGGTRCHPDPPRRALALGQPGHPSLPRVPHRSAGSVHGPHDPG